ncbi:hypothetical protein COO60DRAFT_7597 [Scenedesmus sp. NREL 46B-D3]|nr:hypothetical protein COO60DRAFT_7597 [Scenedesmus sp. NREL 46B-D3]
MCTQRQCQACAANVPSALAQNLLLTGSCATWCFFCLFRLQVVFLPHDAMVFFRTQCSRACALQCICQHHVYVELWWVGRFCCNNGLLVWAAELSKTCVCSPF